MHFVSAFGVSPLLSFQDVAKLEEDLTVPHDSFLDICMEVSIWLSGRLSRDCEQCGLWWPAGTLKPSIAFYTTLRACPKGV